jgi:hypothetical protein
MALHPNFPDDPHVILDPAIRWFPADEATSTKRSRKCDLTLSTWTKKAVGGIGRVRLPK